MNTDFNRRQFHVTTDSESDVESPTEYVIRFDDFLHLNLPEIQVYSQVY